MSEAREISNVIVAVNAGLKEEIRDIRLKILYLDIMIAWLLLAIMMLSWEVADA